jgi:hypothetical protein
VIAKVGSGGQVSFAVPASCAGSVQIVADVQGWFATQSGAGSGTYTPLTPFRDLDTRIGTGTTGPVAGGQTVNLTVTGVGGVPSSGVGAVVLNTTITAPTCAGYLTVFPTGAAQPFASNLNFTAGETVPNLVIAKVGSGGQVSFAVPASCAGSVQIVADVQGWFAS